MNTRGLGVCFVKAERVLADNSNYHQADFAAWVRSIFYE